jgi:hypothetical protein
VDLDFVDAVVDLVGRYLDLVNGGLDLIEDGLMSASGSPAMMSASMLRSTIVAAPAFLKRPVYRAARPESALRERPLSAVATGMRPNRR